MLSLCQLIHPALPVNTASLTNSCSSLTQHSACNSRNPCNFAIQFTHGNLLPKNIIVEGSRVTVNDIVDWATGEFYPAFWEYCRMHDPTFIDASVEADTP